MQILPLYLRISFIILLLSPLTLAAPKALGKKSSPKKLPLKIIMIGSGFSQITDFQFLPRSNKQMVVLQKPGQAWLFDSQTGKKIQILKLKVASQSELGLLGLAFHPKFQQTKKIYINYNPRHDLTRISEWVWSDSNREANPVRLVEERIILEVKQPYKNHNGGSLVFGPDGFLYIGLGDGGYRGDPENRSQDLQSLLGKMLRIDVDKKDPTLAYAVPRDNPFHQDKKNSTKARPEIFASGLRNPWKYSFDNEGRLIAGDVGQDKWEEITFVPKGGNLGWRIYEASHCYDPAKQCDSRLRNHVTPIAEYGHELGTSVTGGYQYRGTTIDELKDRYVFGDFVSGRIWSLTLPQSDKKDVINSTEFIDHGKFDLTISTFAKDANGEIYVADFNGGSIFRLSK
jgi:glucose/arabinose dehydrogenase